MSLEDAIKLGKCIAFNTAVVNSPYLEANYWRYSSLTVFFFHCCICSYGNWPLGTLFSLTLDTGYKGNVQEETWNIHRASAQQLQFTAACLPLKIIHTRTQKSPQYKFPYFPKPSSSELKKQILFNSVAKQLSTDALSMCGSGPERLYRGECQWVFMRTLEIWGRINSHRSSHTPGICQQSLKSQFRDSRVLPV